MDPTQDLAETRKLMASVKKAVDKIIDDFQGTQQEALPTDEPAPGTAPKP